MWYAHGLHSVRRARVVAVLGGVGLGGMRAFQLGVDMVLLATEETHLGEAMAAALAAKRLLVAPRDAATAARVGA